MARTKVCVYMCFVEFLAFSLPKSTTFQTPEQLHSEKVPENLIPHKVMTVYLLLKLNCCKSITLRDMCVCVFSD